jgi:hypothetical protein
MRLKPNLRLATSRFAWLLALWPVALTACSPAVTTEATNAGGGGSGSSSGTVSASGLSSGTVSASGLSSGTVSASGAGTGADETTSGGGDSASGSAAAAPDGGPSASDSATDAGISGMADSSTGGACAGLFCEDFEQGQLDPAKWDTKMGGSGMALVQQKTVAHGKYALHVQDNGTVGNFATILTRNAPATLQGAGPIFGRVYLYLASSIGGTHIQLGFAGTTRDPNVAPTITTSTTVTTTSPDKAINFNYMEFAYFADSWQLGFDLFNPAPAIANGFVEEASYPPARDPYPVGMWSCIEWEFGDDPDMMVLWVDGKQMAQLNDQHIDFSTATKMTGSVLNGKSSGIIGGFAFYGFGIHNWGPSTAVDAYYDDLVLDTKRVNCLQ